MRLNDFLLGLEYLTPKPRYIIGRVPAATLEDNPEVEILYGTKDFSAARHRVAELEAEEDDTKVHTTGLAGVYKYRYFIHDTHATPVVHQIGEQKIEFAA